MTNPNELRLLPWSGPGDKPCYLSTDDPDGYMSRLADGIEAIQLGTASELLAEASEALDARDTEPFPTCGRARRVARSPCLTASNAVGVQPLRGLEQVLGQF
ncbi:hypothetical protein ACQSMD_27480 [Streptomyces flavovirens]|uniref:hypothetical protein n=1 Tax=Streptomyces flavovirens TaxID=52258 RepID=UPI003D0B4361